MKVSKKMVIKAKHAKNVHKRLSSARHLLYLLGIALLQADDNVLNVPTVSSGICSSVSIKEGVLTSMDDFPLVSVLVGVSSAPGEKEMFGAASANFVCQKGDEDARCT